MSAWVLRLACALALVLAHTPEVQGSRLCSHVPPKPWEVVHGVILDPPHHTVRGRRHPRTRTQRERAVEDEPQPLRIRLAYDDSVFRLSSQQFRVINDTVLPQAVKYWEQALAVRRTHSPIRLNRKCEKNKVVYKSKDPLLYCEKGCEASTMCGEVAVPEEHLEACRVCRPGEGWCGEAGRPRGKGVEGADFVLYISAEETDRCHRGLTVAYAAHCQQEARLDRPVAGHANLCPSSISTQTQELDTLLSTVKHEMLHALGFSLSLYAYYRDDQGQPLSTRGPHGRPELNPQLQAGRWSDKVIRKVTREGWAVRGGTVQRDVHLVVMPRVVQEVRNHFGCESLEGAELEDQGEEGTALTHWEKRLFENEAMTGTHTQNPVYSRVTLALMEDTGWYKANYSLAQPLSWGKGLGCEFAMRSCKDWMDARRKEGASLHPFCGKVKRDPLETECSEDRSSVALCNLVQHSVELPKRFQNFERVEGVADDADMAKYGGSVVLADYCPYVQEFTWRANSVALRGSHCLYKENNPTPEKNLALESYGEGSRCFYHSRTMWEERSCQHRRHWQHWGSGCYRFQCSGGLLSVEVSGRSFPCFYAGQPLHVQLYAFGWLHRGAILCPNCSTLCSPEECASESPSRLVQLSWDYPLDSLPCSSPRTSLLSTLALFALSLPTLLR